MTGEEKERRRAEPVAASLCGKLWKRLSMSVVKKRKTLLMKVKPSAESID